MGTAVPPISSERVEGQTSGRPRLLEVTLAVAGLLLLAVITFGPHVLHGGFYEDDWTNAARTHLGGGGYWGAVDRFTDVTANRPVLILYVPLTHVLFGLDPALHLAWGLVIAVVLSAALYMVLRMVGVAKMHSWAISGLVLVFPLSDATRLWATSSHASLAVALLLLGLLAALEGLHHSGRRAVLCHLLAVLLYVLSMLTYELTAAAVLLAGVVYWTQAGRRPAVRRFGVDALAVVATILLVSSHSPQIPQPLAASLMHALAIARDGFGFLAYSAMPFDSVLPFTHVALSTGVVGVVITLLVTLSIGLLFTRILPVGDPNRTTVVRWVGTAVAGVLVMGAGWVLLIPADPGYAPLGYGVVNRINVVAAIGAVLVVYSAAAIAGVVLFRGLTRQALLMPAVPLLVAMFLAVGYVQRAGGDAYDWDRAGGTQKQVLAGVRSLVDDPDPGTTIYTFGKPGFSTPGIPVFQSPGDLTGATRLAYRDQTLRAFPILEGTKYVCEDSRFYPARTEFPIYGPEQGAAYGDGVIFLDLKNDVARTVNSAEACRRAVAQFPAGPTLMRLPRAARVSAKADRRAFRQAAKREAARQEAGK